MAAGLTEPRTEPKMPPPSAADRAMAWTWALVKLIRTGPLTATSATLDFSSATVATPLWASTSSAERTDAAVNGPPSCPAGMAGRPPLASCTGASAFAA